MKLKEIFPEMANLTIKYEVIAAAGIGAPSSEHEHVIGPNDNIIEKIICPNRCGRAVNLTRSIEHCVKNKIEHYEFREKCKGRYESMDKSQVCGTDFVVSLDLRFK